MLERRPLKPAQPVWKQGFLTVAAGVLRLTPPSLRHSVTKPWAAFRWSPAAAAWPPCRAGGSRNMRPEWTCCRCGWARAALPGRSFGGARGGHHHRVRAGLLRAGAPARRRDLTRATWAARSPPATMRRYRTPAARTARAGRPSHCSPCASTAWSCTQAPTITCG